MIADLLHGRCVFPRRISRLAALISPWIPPQARVLDVGCGDGSLARKLMSLRPDISVEGADILIRDRTHIPVRAFDGKTLPYPDGSFDCVLFVDVLHHATGQRGLMREAARVASGCVVIKDHKLEGIAAFNRLRFMDVVGNARFGVALPCDYWSWSCWLNAFQAAQLELQQVETALHLYPWPFDWIFGAGLHFVAVLEPRNDGKLVVEGPG
jgi:SAM-dependent methyltransferase